MNLQTNISPDLWAAVSNPYESENYKHAILEAIHQLSSEIRARAGVDGDGATLVSQALGGETPRLRVNSLQSESERSVQKGMEQLLRGVYLAIRNPRSHEQSPDQKQDADAIIHFIDYLLRIINSSKESFTIESFLETVSDSEFVDTERYAQVLVTEVPANRRGDVLIALYESRIDIDVRKLGHLIRQLLTLLNEAQLEQYLAIVSKQLRITSDPLLIRTSLQMLRPDLWPRLHEAARLRIENKLIQDIKGGEVQSGSKTTGVLGTWAGRYLKNFDSRQETAQLLLAKLDDTDPNDRHYVAKYFLHYFPEIFITEVDIKDAVRIIATKIREGDQNVREALLIVITQYPSEWQSQLAETLKDLTATENPAIYLTDGTPFLVSFVAIEEDDIPF